MNTNKRKYMARMTLLERVALALLIVASGAAAFQRPFQAALFRAAGRETHSARPLRVTFLEVGKGDAMVIETPAGKTLVVDAGGVFGEGDDQGRRVVAPFLRSRGIARIDTLLLTHPHPDHVGGAKTLIEQFPVGLVLDNGVNADSALVRPYRSAAKERGIPCREVRRGATLDADQGVTISALAPTAETLRGKVNNTSIVLRVEYGRTALLLTGDAEADAESEMIRSGQPLACDVLKVGHHGSRASTSEEFVAAARPRYAVISVSANNRMGYPHPEVLERLEKTGARLYRTDRNGAVTCLSDGASVHIETARR
jgi:competence protein ComEC